MSINSLEAASISHRHGVKSKTTLVSMFYDLGKLEDNSRRRQASEYLVLGKQLLQTLDPLSVPLVIFVDTQETADIIAKWRDNMQVIVAPFNELPWFRHMGMIRNLWKAHPPVFPHKLTPEYSCLMWHKTHFLNRVMDSNPFHSTHFAWVDFGMAHIEGVIDNWVQSDDIWSNLPDKVRFVQNKYLRASDFENREFHYCNILDQVLGTVFSGDATHLRRYCALFDEQLRRTVFEEGFVPTDEPIATMLVFAHPDLFDNVFGEFPTILANFRFTRASVDVHLRFLQASMSNSNNALGCNVGKRLLDSFDTKKVTLSGHQYAELLDNYYIVAYYHDRELASGLASRFLGLVGPDEPCFYGNNTDSFRDEAVAYFRKYEDRIRGNLGFIKKKGV